MTRKEKRKERFGTIKRGEEVEKRKENEVSSLRTDKVNDRT